MSVDLTSKLICFIAMHWMHQGWPWRRMGTSSQPAEIPPTALLLNVNPLTDKNKHLQKASCHFNSLNLAAFVARVLCFWLVYTNGRLSMADRRWWTERPSGWNVTLSATWKPSCLIADFFQTDVFGHLPEVDESGWENSKCTATLCFLV